MVQQNRGKRRTQIYNRDERADDEFFSEFKKCLRARLDMIKEENRVLYSEITEAIRELFLPPNKISYKKLFDIIKIMEKDPSKVITFKTLFDLTVKMGHDRKDIVWEWTDRSHQENMKCYAESITGGAVQFDSSLPITRQMYDALGKLDDDTLNNLYRYLLSVMPKELKELANGEEKCRPTMRTIYTLDRIYGQTQRIELEEKLEVAKLSGTEKDTKRSYSFGDIMKIANYTGISPHWLFACDTCLDVDDKNYIRGDKEESNCEITVFSDNLMIERIMDIFTLMGDRQKTLLAYSMQVAMMNAAK